MELVKRFKHTAGKENAANNLDILVYRKSIVWYMTESVESDNKNEFTEDQAYDDYIKNGPPQFVPDLPAEIKNEIDRLVKQKS